MLKDRETLERYIDSKKEKFIFDANKRNEVVDYINQKYNMPVGIITDMIVRSELASQTEFALFCLLDGIGNYDGQDYVGAHFSSIEIQGYSKEKWVEEKIQFPIKLPMLKVTDDQWIGVTDSKFFTQLRKAQLIKYNANAQRILQKIIRGENVIFKIKPNKVAIQAIMGLMKKGLYIPTTITLNIPYDSDAVFKYDETTKMLIIEKIDAFDISDGYHRYLALCELYDEDNDFCYPMELRIINFTEEKTRSFIFQEDQKTKMTQSNSRAMNVNRASNIVVERLNEMSSFYLKGQIGRNSGTIDFGHFSDIVDYIYFNEKKEYTNIDILKAANDIKEKFNVLVEAKPEYLGKILGRRELLLIFYVFSSEPDVDIAVEKIDTALKNGVEKTFDINAKNVGIIFKRIKKIL